MGAKKIIKPFFSVIIPTYNRAEDLRRCLNSLVDQTFKNFEVLICDDGSIDNTIDIVNGFKDKLLLNYIKDYNFGGPARPRNNGIKNAKGIYLAFLDSDDWWFKDKLAYCYEHVDSHDFIFHDVTYYNGTIPYEKSLFNLFENFIRNKNPFKILENGNFIPCSSVCIRKQIVNDDFFSEDKNIIALEDYLAWIKLFKLRNTLSIKHIKFPLSAYSINNDNISASSTKYIYKLLSLKKTLNKELNIKTNEVCLNYLIGSNYILVGNNKRAIVFLIFSLKNSVSFEIKLKSLFKILRIQFIKKNNCNV